MLLQLWLFPFRFITLIREFLYRKIDRTFVGSNLPITPKGNWVDAPKLPSFRYECGGGAVKDDIFVVGGITTPTVYIVSRKTEKYNINSQKWTKVANLPVIVHHPGTTSDGAKFYVVGGNGIRISSRKEVHCYEPQSNSWHRLADLPTKRCALGVAYLNGKIYAAGGADNKTPLSSFESYDILTNTWEVLPDMPTAREHTFAVSHGDNIYVIAGYQNDRFHNLDAFESFNTKTKTWQTLPSVPAKISGFSAAVWGDSIFTFGGEQGWSITNEVYEYKISEKRWYRRPDMPSARYASIAAVTKDGIHVIGGNLRMMTEKFSSEHNIFNP
jgi:N-acetylneuraminic acid mutarotase